MIATRGRVAPLLDLILLIFKIRNVDVGARFYPFSDMWNVDVGASTYPFSPMSNVDVAHGLESLV